MNNILYKGNKLNNFRELVNLYKTIYKNLTAFEYKETPSSTEHIKISYSQFAKDIEDLGAVILDKKFKRVALIGNNKYEWFVSYLAITTAGATVVPLDKSLPDNEIISLIERSQADAVIFSEKYTDAINICKSNNSKLIDICMDNLSDLIKQGQEIDHSKYDSLEIDNKAMSIMLFTSGTTAISKAVMISQYAICMNLYSLSRMIKITTKDKFLSFLPLHHTFESTTTFLFGTSCGITVVLCDGLKYIQKNLVEYKITGFVCVPLMLELMYKKMLKSIEKQGKTKLVNFLRVVFRHSPIWIKRFVFRSIINGLGGKLKTVIAGGASMAKDALQGYNDFGFDVHQGYGLTETGPVLIAESIRYKKPGSIGVEMPGVIAKIDNPDKDGIGEIIAKTPCIMLGYYENENATNEAIDKDGWFHTGDLAYKDKQGYYFITGRKKDMIVLKNGKKIFPEELEFLINKLPYVAESMVFGKEDDSKNDRNSDIILVSKIVYNKDELKKYVDINSEEACKDFILKEVKEKINKQMPAYKYIRDIIVTDIPLIKTTTQKIKRQEEMKIINKK